MDLEQVIQLVSNEYKRASKLFPKFTSPHEGYAVLLEEVDELWDDIKANKNPKTEAIQVASMAVRFLIDVCENQKGDE